MGISIGFIEAGNDYQVSTFSELALINSPSVGEIAIVDTTTGIWLLGTQKEKGQYRYSGATWDFYSQDLKDRLISNEIAITSLQSTSHTHSNKTILDDITSAFTTTLKAKLDSITAIFTFDLKIAYDACVTFIASISTVSVPDTVNKRYQTDNQRAFNDATSSIQTQLNSKPTLVSGFISDSVIPASITRDSELSAAISAAIAGITGSAPLALDTIVELANALQNNPSVVSQILSDLGNRLRFDGVQSLTTIQKNQALENLGLPNTIFSGTNLGDETTLSIQTKRPLKTIEGQILEGAGNLVLFTSLADGEFWNKNQFTGSATGSIPYLTQSLLSSGTISQPNEMRVTFPYGHALLSSATVNSGVRYFSHAFVSAPNIFQNYVAELYFMMPSVNVATRNIRFGYKDGTILPAAVQNGFYAEITNLTISAKSVLVGNTTTNISTFVLSQMTPYKLVVSVNSDRTNIRYALFVFGNSTPVWSANITTNITTGSAHAWEFIAQNTGAAISTLIYAYAKNFGSLQARNRMG
jgi:hypothetical protein